MYFAVLKIIWNYPRVTLYVSCSYYQGDHRVRLGLVGIAEQAIGRVMAVI